MRTEILKVVSKVCQRAFQLFFHLKPAVIRAYGNLLFSRSGTPTRTLNRYVALARKIRSQRRQYRALIHAKRVARRSRAHFALSNDLLPSLVNDTHTDFGF